MGFAQYTQINIHSNLATATISLRNVQVTGGSFYRNDDSEEVMESDEANQLTVAPQTSYEVYARGPTKQFEGSAGQFDLYDDDTKICTMAWDCRFQNKDSTTFDLRDSNEAAGYTFLFSDFERGKPP